MSDTPSDNDFRRALTLIAPQKDDPTSAADVESLKTRFIASSLPLGSFCDLYASDVHLAPSTLQGIAVRQKWVAARRLHREDVSTEAREALRKNGIEFETKLDGLVHRASKKLVRLISEILQNTTEIAARKREDGQSAVTLDDLPKLRAGTEALNAAYTLARKTAGLSAEPMPGRNDINLERLSPDERETMKSLLLKAAGTRRAG